jgi:peptidoglycan-associated lipoprotein
MKGICTMTPALRLAGLATAAALLSMGCGHKAGPEQPQPQPAQEAPSEEPRYESTPVTSEPISDKLLANDKRAALEERIFFEFDRSDLNAAARENLSAKAEILRATPSLSLRIEGHADERGSDEYNLALSNRRAAAALRFLTDRGIASSRLSMAGYGEEQPLDPAENESAWAKNRRAEFRISGGNLAQQ